jgi:hypothetical protein
MEGSLGVRNKPDSIFVDARIHFHHYVSKEELMPHIPGTGDWKHINDVVLCVMESRGMEPGEGCLYQMIDEVRVNCL